MRNFGLISSLVFASLFVVASCVDDVGDDAGAGVTEDSELTATDESRVGVEFELSDARDTDVFDEQLINEESSDQAFNEPTGDASSAASSSDRAEGASAKQVVAAAAAVPCGLSVSSQSRLHTFFRIRNCHSFAVRRKVFFSNVKYTSTCFAIGAHRTVEGFALRSAGHLEGLKRC